MWDVGWNLYPCLGVFQIRSDRRKRKKSSLDNNWMWGESRWKVNFDFLISLCSWMSQSAVELVKLPAAVGHVWSTFNRPKGGSNGTTTINTPQSVIPPLIIALVFFLNIFQFPFNKLDSSVIEFLCNVARSSYFYQQFQLTFLSSRAAFFLNPVSLVSFFFLLFCEISAAHFSLSPLARD